MPILIDGHNLIGRMSLLSLADADDEEALVKLLQPYRARTGKAITVVFDPGAVSVSPRKRRVGGVEVVFAPHGSSAVAVIARRVEKSQDRRGWLVVTSDRALAERVSSLGARVLPADDLAEELERPAAAGSVSKEQPLSPEEIAKWLALFEKNGE